MRRDAFSILPAIVVFFCTPLQFAGTSVHNLVATVSLGGTSIQISNTTKQTMSTVSEISLLDLQIGTILKFVAYIALMVLFVGTTWSGIYASETRKRMYYMSKPGFRREYTLDMTTRNDFDAIETKQKMAQAIVWFATTVGFIPITRFMVALMMSCTFHANDLCVVSSSVLYIVFAPFAVAILLQSGRLQVFTMQPLMGVDDADNGNKRLISNSANVSTVMVPLAVLQHYWVSALSPHHWLALARRQASMRMGALTVLRHDQQLKYSCALLFAKVATAVSAELPMEQFGVTVPMMNVIAISLVIAGEILWPHLSSVWAHRVRAALYSVGLALSLANVELVAGAEYFKTTVAAIMGLAVIVCCSKQASKKQEGQ